MKIVRIALVLASYAYCLLMRVDGNDVSLNVFTNQGDVAQVAFAAKAVTKSNTKIGFVDRSTGASVFLSLCNEQSHLRESTHKTIQCLDESQLLVMPAGYTPDCEYVCTEVYRIIHSHYLQFGETPNLELLSHRISRWVTRGLYGEEEKVLQRPLAASLVIASCDPLHIRNRIYQVDSTGKYTERTLSILGLQPPLHVVKKIERIVLEDVGNCAALDRLIEKVSAILELVLGDEQDVECGVMSPNGQIALKRGLHTAEDTANWIRRIYKMPQ